MPKLNTKDPRNLAIRRISTLLGTFGVLILIFALVSWWQYHQTTPDRVFAKMIENNLRTTSVTKHVVEETGAQEVDQRIRLQTGHQQVAHGKTTLRQEGEVSANVKTETIGTPTEDYIRYTKIDTNQITASGKQSDFSNIIDVWAKSTSIEGQTGTGELYGEMVLGILPFTNLQPEARNRLLGIIRENNVYETRGEPQKFQVGGRPTYVYNVTVNPEGYITMLRELGREQGIGQLSELDPTAYREAEPFQVELLADVWSQRLVGIRYSDGRQESYGDYGVKNFVTIPRQTISIEELQLRIQQASQ